jgi:hypothetical protein
VAGDRSRCVLLRARLLPGRRARHPTVGERLELRVACDQRYPGIIAEIGRALGGRVAEYSYVLHFFSNLSSDIRGIFVEHCRVLGIRVTQSNHRNLSIPHRHSVAMLEQIVGPKT